MTNGQHISAAGVWGFSHFRSRTGDDRRSIRAVPCPRMHGVHLFEKALPLRLQVATDP